MYYPYLRGRQFELIALREYAIQRGENNNIVPVIEPVKRTFSSLKIAISKFIEGNLQFALILNPEVGEIKNISEIVDNLSEELNVANWIPSFIVTNNYTEVSSYIKEFNYQNVMIICTEASDTSEDGFKALLMMPEIEYIVTKGNRTLKRKLRGKGKKIIKLDASFKAQKKNSDYLKIGAQKFTEEHLFYGEEGYHGFSDYTVLISEFIEGGGPAYAVSIHLTYLNDNEEIWVRHFTSESNMGIANIQGKFHEALKKAIVFIDDNEIHTYASEELRKYFELKKYPGLGMVKKISIKNHLELINKAIN